MIDFDEEKVRILRSLYDRAVARSEQEFQFYGHPLRTDYAKYLLEYLEAIYATQARREAH